MNKKSIKSNTKIGLFFLILILFFLYKDIILIYLFKENPTLELEIINIEKYIRKIKANIPKKSKNFYNKSLSPKISIVIPVYNGELFIKTSYLSISNQNFKDIEIIYIDDCSTDNSVDLIKELMMDDKRIELYINQNNKGILFTKSQGILKSKGKYVMILDQDDIYVQNDAFSTLFEVSEKDNLDILGFSAISAYNNFSLLKKVPVHYYESKIIFQPKIRELGHTYTSNGDIKRVNSAIWIYFFKTELFKKAVSQIDYKFYDTKMICHDDFLFFFLLSRFAEKTRSIKRIFYGYLRGSNKNYSYIKIKEGRENSQCQSFLNYIEFILLKTNNSIVDKKIASYELNTWFLEHKCRNNSFIQEKAKKICLLFLKNKYIEKHIKKQILDFFKSQNKK